MKERNEMSLLDQALLQQIDEWLEGRAIERTEEQKREMLRGVSYWFSETVGDSIDTANDLV
jgi:hypothetical protein